MSTTVVGALRGAMTITKFFAQGGPVFDPGGFLKAIRANAFRPMNAEEDDAARCGWCVVGEPLTLDLSHGRIYVGDCIALGLRYDHWVVPRPLLSQTLREDAAALCEKREVPKLGRKAMSDLKLFVNKKLRKGLVPTMSGTDVVWNTKTGVVHVMTQSKSRLLLVEALFTRTFTRDLLPASPGILAHRLGYDPETTVGWAGLTPIEMGVAS